MDAEGRDAVQALAWTDAGLSLLDQRLLPERCERVLCADAAAVADAIRRMVVRGAPAIGIAAAYGAALAARDRFAVDPGRWRQAMEADLAVLETSRPTAVNLRWALDRMRARARGLEVSPGTALLEEARAIHAEDVAANRRIGELGASLIEHRCPVITHCNAGALATGGYGTALGVIRSAWAAGKLTRVFADETRPWLQGARLTAWELVQEGIPVSLIADSAAGWAMQTEGVAWAVVGADRIAANGDVANKIGTCALAVNARFHGVRFMVAAPVSTIDPATPDGASIPIEQRDPAELLKFGDRSLAPAGAQAWNPVFDVTPAALVDVIVTEAGLALPPYRESLAALLAR